MSTFVTSSDFVDGVRYHVLVNGAPRGPLTKDGVLDLHTRAVISEDTPGCITSPQFQLKPPNVASWLPIRTLLPDILDKRHKRNGDTAAVIDCPSCGAQLRLANSGSTLWRCPSCRARLRIHYSQKGNATAEVEAEHHRPESEPSPPPSSSRKWGTPFDILGVAQSATLAEIKAAYRSRIQEYHPDKVAALGPELRALAEEKSKLINEAYKRLTDSRSKI